MSELIEYKCPHCGGELEFNSDIQKMKCPYCMSEIEMDALKKYDEELINEQSQQMDWERENPNQWQEGETDNMAVYTCKSCGGEIIGDKTTAASQCPYCGNQVVMKGQFSGDLKPDYVIPFKLNKNNAVEALNKHLKGKILLPKIFKDKNHIDEIKGIYVPFWLFDADVNADLRYKGTRISSWTSGGYRYTKTSYYSIRRGGNISFDKVPVDGSSKMPDDLMESIEPFDFNDAVDFQTAYLAGYLADRYDVDDRQSYERANNRIKQSTIDSFRSTISGYSTVTPEGSNISLSSGKAKYALYPVWILNTTYKDKKYIFAMNGQTGKFVGDLPICWATYWKWFALCAGVVGLATFLLMFFGII